MKTKNTFQVLMCLRQSLLCVPCIFSFRLHFHYLANEFYYVIRAAEASTEFYYIKM